MRILLVDDEPGIQEILTLFLTKAGHQVATAADGDQAFQIFCERGPFDVVLSDIEHPGPNGIELQKMIRDKNPEQPMGFLTGHRVLCKPFAPEQLLEFVERLKPSR